MYNHICNKEEFILPNYTAIGGLAYYITHCESENFQPMNTNWGVILSNLGIDKCRDKLSLSNKSLEYIKKLKGDTNGTI